MGIAEGFAQIAAQQGTIWLQSGGGLQVAPAFDCAALANPAEAAAQPGVAERAVSGYGLIEGGEGGVNPVLGAQDEAPQGESFGIARRECQGFFQRLFGGVSAAEGKLQLGHSRPGEPEIGRYFHRETRRVQSSFKIGTLLGIRMRQIFGRQPGRARLRQRPARNGGNDFTQRGSLGRRLSQGRQQALGFIHLAGGKQQRGVVNAFRVGLGRPARGIRVKGLAEISAQVGGNGRRERGRFCRAEGKLLDVQHARVVKPPLDDIGGLERWGFNRRLPRQNKSLFTICERNAYLSIGESYFAVEHREQGLPGFNCDREFGAARGADGVGSLEQKLAGFVAGEKVNGA